MFFLRSDMMFTVMSIKQYIARCFCDVVIRKWKIENHAILEQNEMIFFFTANFESQADKYEMLNSSREKKTNNMAMDRNQQNITIKCSCKTLIMIQHWLYKVDVHHYLTVLSCWWKIFHTKTWRFSDMCVLCAGGHLWLTFLSSTERNSLPCQNWHNVQFWVSFLFRLAAITKPYFCSVLWKLIICHAYLSAKSICGYQFI